MSALVRYHWNVVQQALMAVRLAIEFWADPTLAAFEDACARQVAIDGLRTLAAWWQSDSGRYQHEIQRGKAAFLHTDGYAMTVAVVDDQRLVFHGHLALDGAEPMEVTVHFPEDYPTSPPEVRRVEPGGGLADLMLNLRPAWDSSKDVSFALHAAADLLAIEVQTNGGRRQGKPRKEV